MSSLVIIMLMIRIRYVLSDISCSMDPVHVAYNYSAACTSAHVREAVRYDKMCSPRPVIVQLPWPNNTNVQQVKTIGNFAKE